VEDEREAVLELVKCTVQGGYIMLVDFARGLVYIMRHGPCHTLPTRPDELYGAVFFG